jgi:biopolymer transport protein TolR
MAQVNNPEQMPDADKEDALLVSITRDGKVYFGSEQIQDVDSLTTKVKDRFASKPGDRRVYVKADMRTRFGGVVKVVDSVRAAGVDDLGLLTDQKKTATPPPPPPAAGQ